MEARRHPRFKLEVSLRIYPRNCTVVRGHTVDISESGISAMLREEVPMAKWFVWSSPCPGDVEILALVRQRNAFRYGFQFVEATSAQDVIGRTCRQLDVEQSVCGHSRELSCRQNPVSIHFQAPVRLRERVSGYSSCIPMELWAV